MFTLPLVVVKTIVFVVVILAGVANIKASAVIHYTFAVKRAGRGESPCRADGRDASRSVQQPALAGGAGWEVVVAVLTEQQVAGSVGK